MRKYKCTDGRVATAEKMDWNIDCHRNGHVYLQVFEDEHRLEQDYSTDFWRCHDYKEAVERLMRDGGAWYRVKYED